MKVFKHLFTHKTYPYKNVDEFLQKSRGEWGFTPIVFFETSLR